MTEDEWLNGWEPETPLTFLDDKTSDRKLRLFGVACCRAAGVEFTEIDPAISQWLSVIERYADGLATESERETLQGESLDLTEKYCDAPDGEAAGAAYGAIRHLADDSPNFARQIVYCLWNLESEFITYTFEVRPLLHEVFGNPFRPVVVDLEWLTSTVTQLARGIYEERAFDRMPILADALQDAGCDNPDILTHCRDESVTHVRGCWVVDLLLGKS